MCALWIGFKANGSENEYVCRKVGGQNSAKCLHNARDVHNCAMGVAEKQQLHTNLTYGEVCSIPYTSNPTLTCDHRSQPGFWSAKTDNA